MNTETLAVREIILSYKHKRGATYPKITSASSLAPFLPKLLTTPTKEHFIALYLDGEHKIISHSIVSIGLLTETQVHPREVFQPALMAGARAVIVAHNHPSGSLLPSDDDKKVTKQLKEASKILGIILLDHVIFTDDGKYYSFSDSEITFH
jgi:DNA repair protein RadC